MSTEVGSPADVAEAAAVPALKVNGLGLRYGGVVALKDVSFEIAPGETCGLIGPNGAGKTSLFDVISGLTKPTSGQIHLAGRDITTASAVFRSRSGLRRTYQRVQVFGRLTVLENLLAATEWRGGGGGILADLVRFPTRRNRENERREVAETVLSECGLSSLRDTYAGSLPVGFARMLEFARAVVDRPQVLLLDEPTSGLDKTESERLGEAMDAIASTHRTAILLVEHDFTFVERHSHRIIVLNMGEVLASGTAEDVQANEAVRAAYIG